MIYKDYLMRMLLLLVKALAEIAFKKDNKKYDEALQLTGGLFEQMLGLSSRLVNSADVHDLLKMLGSDADRIIIAAILLKEEGEIYESLKRYEESDERYTKAMYLFMEAYLNGTNTSLSEYFTAIPGLIGKMGLAELPCDLRLMLFKYYERTGSYSKCEDMLFEFLEDNGYDSETLEMGVEFYGRMQQKTDEELVRGNLPRNELGEGLAILMERKKE